MSGNPLDITVVRREFPALTQTVPGRPLVYLDNAATTQKPREVIEAVSRHYADGCANVHRGVHKLSLRATKAFEEARAKLADFVGAERPEEMVFVRGATEGINLIAQSFGGSRIKSGDEILVTELEHHSNIVPWQMLRQRTGAVLKVAPIDDRGELRLDALMRMLSSRTRIVACTHVSNAIGTINPIEKIVETAHRHGAVVVVDGAQAAAHLPIDVRKLGCDFYVLSGHKTFGPTGIGVLYGRFDLLDQMPPYQGGGEMIRSVTFEKTTYDDAPHRFEAGTPDIAGAIGLAAAVDFLRRLDFDRLEDHERGLFAYAVDRLAEVPGLRRIGQPSRSVPILNFTLEGWNAHDAAVLLDQEGICVRSGHHCAQPLMARFGVSETIRASLAFYNTRDEVDSLIRCLHRLAGAGHA